MNSFFCNKDYEFNMFTAQLVWVNSIMPDICIDDRLPTADLVEVDTMPKYIEQLVSEQVRRSELARYKEVESGNSCKHPVITLSRTMGSGARIVAQKLAADLGWSIWDKELLDAIAKDADVSHRVVETFDERTLSEINQMALAALGDYAMSDYIYAKHLARSVTAIAKLGDAIILGRGANFLLPDALSVRLDASWEKRLANMMRYEECPREQAEVKLRNSDRDRQNFVYRMFGKDRVNAFHYDLSIWMDKFTADDAAEIIKTALAVRCKQCA